MAGGGLWPALGSGRKKSVATGAGGGPSGAGWATAGGAGGTAVPC